MLAGAPLPETHQLGKDRERFRPKVVLHHLDLLFNDPRRQPHQLQQFAQRFVADLDVCGDRPAVLSQSQAAVPFIIDVAAAGQPLSYRGYLRAATPTDDAVPLS